MVNKGKSSGSNLESGLMQALKALDNQVSRALERTPAEREESGVQKWKPYSERVELVSGFLLDSFAEEEIGLDSLLILAQVFPKVLSILGDELGEEGLGKIRSSYFQSVLESVERESGRALRQFRGGQNELM